MTADLSFVTDTTQAQPCIVTTHAAGDGTCNGGLTHAGRAGQTENLTLDAAGEVLHGEKFQNAFLDLFQAIMIFVQNGACLADIIVFFPDITPGKIQTNIQIGAGYTAFGRGRLHFCKALDLFQQLFFHFFGHCLGGNLVAVLLSLLGSVLPFSQFLIDGLHLFAEIVIPLALVHLSFDLFLNILLQMQNLQFFGQQAKHQRHAAARLLYFQNPLLVFKGHLHVLGNVIRKATRLSCGHDVHNHIAGHLGCERGIFHEQFLGVAHHGLITLGNTADLHFGKQLDIGS